LTSFCTHLQDALQFIQCYRVHAIQSAKKRFLSRLLQKFALFSTALFTIKVHSELSPTLAGVQPARFSMSESTSYTCCNREAASGYLFVMAWDSDFSDASSWSSISGILVLEHPPSWCILNFAVCFVVSHSAAHTRGPAANFTSTTFAKREFAVNTLLKMKSVKTTLSNKCVVQFTKYNQDLV
jgi:hypothetical protein